MIQNTTPPASDRLAAEEMRGAVSISQDCAEEVSFSHGAALTAVDQQSDTTLRALLERLDQEGWTGSAGRGILEILRRESIREAAKWESAAGTLGEVAVAAGWEAIESWRASDRTRAPISFVRQEVSRVMRAETAAAQLGTGDPVQRRRLVQTMADLRQQDPSRTVVRSMRAEFDESVYALQDEPTAQVAMETPPWLRVVARLLERQGWTWPQAPLSCLELVWVATEEGRKRSASALDFTFTGVPTQTWSALALLVAGSGPGCRLENRWYGAGRLFEVGGARAVCGSTEVRRIVRHAVAGTAVRSSRRAARSDAA